MASFCLGLNVLIICFVFTQASPVAISSVSRFGVAELRSESSCDDETGEKIDCIAIHPLPHSYVQSHRLYV